MTSVKSILIYILGIASTVLSAIPAVDMPSSVRPALAIAGVIIVAVERFLQGSGFAAKAAAAKAAAK